MAVDKHLPGFGDADTRHTHTSKGCRHEDNSVLRRSRYAHPRRVREYTEADDPDRRQADSVASDALLQPVRPQGLRLVPWLQGKRRQGILPELQAADLR